MAKKKAAAEAEQKPNGAIHEVSKKRGRPRKEKPEGQTVVEAAAEIVEAGKPQPGPFEPQGDPVELLRELAELSAYADKAKARWEEAAQVAKSRKQAYDGCMERLHERIKTATSRVPMPLFDQDERNADLTAMQVNRAGDAAATAQETAQDDAGADETPF